MENGMPARPLNHDHGSHPFFIIFYECNPQHFLRMIITSIGNCSIFQVKQNHGRWCDRRTNCRRVGPNWVWATDIDTSVSWYTARRTWCHPLATLLWLSQMFQMFWKETGQLLAISPSTKEPFPLYATSPTQTSGQSETSHQPQSASKATGGIISPWLVLQKENVCFGSNYAQPLCGSF